VGDTAETPRAGEEPSAPGEMTYPAAWHHPGGPVVISLAARSVDPASAALMLMLGRLARRFETLLAGALREHELDSSQFTVLTMLSFQTPPVGMNLARLNRNLDMSSGGITKAVSRLTRQGLVERVPDPADRRVTIIRLSDKGRTLHAEVFAGLDETWQHAFSVVDEQHRWELFESVREILTLLWPESR
jgi:DNA-binding MarR family transcriptional regulator